MAKGTKPPFTNICYSCTVDSYYQCDKLQMPDGICTRCRHKQATGKGLTCERTRKTIPEYEADVAVNRQRVALRNTAAQQPDQQVAQPQQQQLPVNLPQQQVVNPAPGYTMIFNMPTTSATPTPQQMQFATQGAPTPPGMAQFQANGAPQGTPQVPTPAGGPQGPPQVLAVGKNHERNVSKKANKRLVDPTTGQSRTQQAQYGYGQRNQQGYGQRNQQGYGQHNHPGYGQQDQESDDGDDMDARRNTFGNMTNARRQADRDRFAQLERRVAEAEARAAAAESRLQAPRTGYPEANSSLSTHMDTGDDPVIHPGTSIYDDVEEMDFPPGRARPKRRSANNDPEEMDFPPGIARPKRRSANNDPEEMNFPPGIARPKRRSANNDPEEMNFPPGIARPKRRSANISANVEDDDLDKFTPPR